MSSCINKWSIQCCDTTRNSVQILQAQTSQAEPSCRIWDMAFPTLTKPLDKRPGGRVCSN